MSLSGYLMMNNIKYALQTSYYGVYAERGCCTKIVLQPLFLCVNRTLFTKKKEPESWKNLALCVK